MKPQFGLSALEAYRINVYGLSNKVHQYDYEIESRFFERYGTSLIENGTFAVTISLDKHETFIEAQFHIKGKANLVCDRSLEVFEYPIEVNNKILFKFGEEFQEISDEILIIPRETVFLEVGQYIYEFIVLSIPMKKLHPKFQIEEGEDGTIVYSSKKNDENKDGETDPRWEILKKLK